MPPGGARHRGASRRARFPREEVTEVKHARPKRNTGPHSRRLTPQRRRPTAGPRVRAILGLGCAKCVWLWTETPLPYVLPLASQSRGPAGARDAHGPAAGTPPSRSVSFPPCRHVRRLRSPRSELCQRERRNGPAGCRAPRAGRVHPPLTRCRRRPPAGGVVLPWRLNALFCHFRRRRGILTLIFHLRTGTQAAFCWDRGG